MHAAAASALPLLRRWASAFSSTSISSCFSILCLFLFFLIFQCSSSCCCSSFVTRIAARFSDMSDSEEHHFRVQGRRRRLQDLPAAGRHHPQERIHRHQEPPLQGTTVPMPPVPHPIACWDLEFVATENCYSLTIWSRPLRTNCYLVAIYFYFAVLICELWNLRLIAGSEASQSVRWIH